MLKLKLKLFLLAAFGAAAIAKDSPQATRSRLVLPAPGAPTAPRSTTTTAAASAASTSTPAPIAPGTKLIEDVKTTAYTHTESDHLEYGRKTAAGGTLKYGTVRSAAADWSVYPVGTQFQIAGDPQVYEVDDYGSALVGTRTIDLYKPSAASMNAWGARKVDIKILKWGSFARSLAIMQPRQSKSWHIRAMIDRIKLGLHRNV